MSLKPIRKVIFAGTPEFAACALRALIQDGSYEIIAVYTQPDRPAGRGRKLTASPVKELALAHNLPVYQPPSLKQLPEQDELKALHADLMIVAAYGLILPQAVLDMPKYGCINIHGSLLPRWRGAAPIQRAILEGDTETGITIMQMDAGLDTGAMLYEKACPILPVDTSETLHDRLAVLGAEALLEALTLLQQDKLFPEKQNDSEAKYAHKLTKEEARIDWQESADVIARKVRAYNPWPVANFQLGDESVRVWEASVKSDVMSSQLDKASDALSKNGASASSGQGVMSKIQEAIPYLNELPLPGKVILNLSAGEITVSTGNGELILRKLQFPGGKILSAADVLNGRKADFLPGVQLT